MYGEFQTFLQIILKKSFISEIANPNWFRASY